MPRGHEASEPSSAIHDGVALLDIRSIGLAKWDDSTGKGSLAEYSTHSYGMARSGEKGLARQCSEVTVSH